MSKSVHVYQGVFGLPNIAKHVGIPISSLSHRIYQQGMTLEQAIAFGLPKKEDFKYVYKGIYGLRKIADAFGINQRTLENRVIQRGMSVEEALNTPVRKRSSNSTKRRSKTQKLVKPENANKLWNLALGMGGC